MMVAHFPLGVRRAEKMCRRCGKPLASTNLRSRLDLASLWRVPICFKHRWLLWEIVMAFEDVKAEIGLLLTKMQNEPEDRHELYLQLMERLNELKAYGMPVPQDLQDLEAALAAEFTEEAGDAA
jgi:hypothetical protein